MDPKLYITRCLELASKAKGYTSPNPLVGCVVVKNGKVIAEGYHHKFGDKHAEIDALDKVRGKAEGAELYVNLEPCCFTGKTGPCTERIIKEKIGKVFIGSLDPNKKVAGKGVEKLKQAGVDVEVGILEEECMLLNQFFFKFIKTGLPYITLKMAQSSDHFVAYPDGTPTHITNKKSGTFVHKMRSWYDAVLVGKGTLISDNPALTIRHVTGRQPFRLVLDSQAEMITSSKKLLTDEYANKTIWVVDKNAKFQNPHKIEVIGTSNLKDLLKQLTDRNISSVFVEGGPKVWKSFIDENLADQIQLFAAEKKLQNGIPVLPNNQLPENIKHKKAEAMNFGSDKLEIKYLKLW